MPHESAKRPRGTVSQWGAVLRRDRSADGQFVYAVRSTGVYCRPTCPSRRPRRDRVTFFDSPDAAETAGFRACLRCRPRGPAPADPWPARIEQACADLARSRTAVPLARLARRMGVSPFHLQRTFRRLVGLTPREYADACRLARVKHALEKGSRVTDAIIDAGYGASSSFYERGAPLLGMAPSAYRRGGAGLVIRYAVVDSPLGRLLVATTDRGVCSVAIGSSTGAVLRLLAGEYPAARLAATADSSLARSARRIVDYLEGKRSRLELPIDVRATAFQWQVWTALAAIPRGDTRTYAQVARSIGRPSAARAVARACASNPVAVLIPCHRVVPAKGGVGGYRWGVSRKKRLLTREAGGRMPAR